jgi:outer membrane protein TolC
MSHTGVSRILFFVVLMGTAPLIAQTPPAGRTTPAGPTTPARQSGPALQTAAPGQSPPKPVPPGDDAQPYQPPQMRFEATGMTLLEAITLTLQHDPNIKLRQTDIELQAGVVREQKGQFDAVFHLQGSFDREQTELLDTQKADEQKKRDDLKTALTQVTDLTNSLTAAGALLANKDLAFNNPAGFDLSTIKDKNVLTQMQILQSELQLYKDVLVSPSLTDNTVRQDILNLRDKTVGQNIDAFNAQQAQIAGLPADLQKQITNLGPTPSEQWTKNAELTFDVTKLFRNGISVKPNVDLTYKAQNFVGKDKTDTDFGGQGISPSSSGKIAFDVVIPLLRGAGKTSVDAAEIASKYDLEATRLQMLFQQSESVLATIQAYWQVRSAADQVDVLRRAVAIEGDLANLTRALIAANEKPRSDEARVAAATADARSRYEAALRQLNDARITLAQLMGVALADALSIPLAKDAYPQPPPTLTIDAQAYTQFITDSAKRRFDLQSALQSESSGKALVDGARIDTRPLLNINASGFGTSAHEGLNYSSWVFRSGNVGASFEKPFGNNTAKGLLEQRRATLRQTEISAADLNRVIGLHVVQLGESLKVAAEQVRAAQDAVNAYDQTMTTEQARLKAGDSSLIDSILTEQQTTAARLALISAQANYASLVAQLRHEAGLLVQDGSVDAVQVVAVPQALVGR